MPSASTARTRNECPPPASAAAGVYGEVHGAYAPKSSAHVTVAEESSHVNSIAGRGSLDGSGGTLVISSAGKLSSEVHVRVAGVGSTLPVASMARTANVC